MKTTCIAMWSGPRNISTAMMRAWENRADTTVMDEPFYACYLAETGMDHPMRAEVLAAQSTDWSEVAKSCTDPAPGGAIVFQKHMAQHMVAAAPLDWLRTVSNAFLIRPPEAVLASYHQSRSDPTAEDVGFARQAEIFDRVADHLGDAPPVLEARDVLENPQKLIRSLCQALGAPFDPAMLSWPQGRRKTDGAWAPHWYGAVEKSTTFAPYTAPKPLPDHLRPVAEACRPHYEKLRAHKLQ